MYSAQEGLKEYVEIKAEITPGREKMINLINMYKEKEINLFNIFNEQLEAIGKGDVKRKDKG